MATFKDKRAFFADGLQNILTGLGLFGSDKSTSSRFIDKRLTYGELEAAYANDWLAGKVCDVPPFDMTRNWRRLDGKIKPENLEIFLREEKRLNVKRKFKEVLTLSRIYGGAGIIINVDDGLDPSEPLDLDRIKKGSLRWLLVSDSQYLKPRSFDHDPFSINYGYPLFYNVAPSSIRIHHSRVIRFEPVPLPLAARRRNQYWGKSIIERLYSALVNAASIQANTGALVYEASIDVIKIPDLIDRVSTKEGEKAVSNRFSIAKMQKSINKLLLLDTEEEYETHQQTFAGLNELMEKYLDIVAGAADIPITRLLGQSPGGLNSTGESDLRNYYDFISGQQEALLTTKIESIDEIIYRSCFGTAPDNGELDFTFNNLWDLNDQQVADLQLARAQRDLIYLDRGVIGDEIVCTELMNENTYSYIDSDYIDSISLDDIDDIDENDNSDIIGRHDNHSNQGKKDDTNGNDNTNNTNDPGSPSNAGSDSFSNNRDNKLDA